MALLFILAGVIGLIVTLFAMQSNAYRLLSARYQEQPAEDADMLAATAPGEA
jgi:hypothetical protein